MKNNNNNVFSERNVIVDRAMEQEERMFLW